MKKYLLAATGAMALSFSANANAATFITFTTPTSAFFTSSPVPCTVSTKPCSFAHSFSFVTPVGYQLVNASIISNTGAEKDNSDIDFTSVLLNGTNFVISSTGINESRFLNNFGLVALANNTINVNGIAYGTRGSYSGVLSFAAVPEPSTWLMMILGVGLAGAALRRRRQTVKVSYA